MSGTGEYLPAYKRTIADLERQLAKAQGKLDAVERWMSVSAARSDADVLLARIMEGK